MKSNYINVWSGNLNYFLQGKHLHALERLPIIGYTCDQWTPLSSMFVKSLYRDGEFTLHNRQKVSVTGNRTPVSPWQAGILTTILSRIALVSAIRAKPIIGVIEPCQKVKETAAAYVKFYQGHGVYSLVQVNWQKLDRVILDNVLHLIDEE